MEKYLDNHDAKNGDGSGGVYHQGMVIAQTKRGINSAYRFCDLYNCSYPGHCEVYDGDSPPDVLTRFTDGKIRTLVIIGRLLEGFDHKPVSVLGIVRNIAESSRVLFTQFVGRAVRKTSVDDPIDAQIVTHVCFNQRVNYDNFDQVTDVYPEEEVEEED